LVVWHFQTPSSDENAEILHEDPRDESRPQGLDQKSKMEEGKR